MGIFILTPNLIGYADGSGTTAASFLKKGDMIPRDFGKEGR